MRGAGWMRIVRGGMVAALATVGVLAGPAAAGADGGVRRDLKVMTQNLYLGSSLNPVLVPPPPGVPPDVALVLGVQQIYATVVATDFAVRAAAIADHIAVERPDVIGLQEVSRWDVDLNNPAATAPSFDFLEILQDELAARGLNYVAEAISENVAVGPAPLLAPPYGCIVVAALPATSDCTISFLDRDVILVNRDAGIRVSNQRDANFDAQQVLPVPVLGGLSFNRGWASIDGTFQGAKFRVVNTHLEVETFRTVQEAQARELVHGPLATLRPVILVGDLNSAADGSTTASYRTIVKALFADAWWTNLGRIPGYTCCQAERLDNTVSQLTSRIDFVLARLALPTSARLVNDVQIATTPPLWAADHAGVLATVRLF